MINGLYHHLVNLRAAKVRAAADASDYEAEPRVAHDAAFRVGEVTRSIREVETAIAEDEHAIRDIELMITAMKRQTRKSDHRDLAIRHLEDASMRLQRELGDKP